MLLNRFIHSGARGVACSALLAATALAVGNAVAQEWPARPVRLVVPFAPGGSADVFGRAVGTRLQETLGQSFVIENRPGAGSIIGTDVVAKSPPDGYTFLIMSNTHTVNESLIANKPFQLMRDFEPVAPINESDLVLVALVLVFVDVLKELPATLLVRPFNFDTLAVHVHGLASDERLAQAAAPALAIVLAGLAPVCILAAMIRRSRAGGGAA